jgi:hypothetical protein
MKLLLEGGGDVALHELAGGLEGSGLVEVNSTFGETAAAPEALEGMEDSIGGVVVEGFDVKSSCRAAGDEQGPALVGDSKLTVVGEDGPELVDEHGGEGTSFSIKSLLG